MLVVTRSPGESVTMVHEGVQIVVHILDANKSRVRVGIVAPSHVEIMRTEILTRSKEREIENKTNGENARVDGRAGAIDTLQRVAIGGREASRVRGADGKATGDA